MKQRFRLKIVWSTLVQLFILRMEGYKAENTETSSRQQKKRGEWIQAAMFYCLCQLGISKVNVYPLWKFSLFSFCFILFACFSLLKFPSLPPFSHLFSFPCLSITFCIFSLFFSVLFFFFCFLFSPISYYSYLLSLFSIFPYQLIAFLDSLPFLSSLHSCFILVYYSSLYNPFTNSLYSQT